MYLYIIYIYIYVYEMENVNGREKHCRFKQCMNTWRQGNRRKLFQLNNKCCVRMKTENPKKNRLIVRTLTFVEY